MNEGKGYGLSLISKIYNRARLIAIPLFIIYPSIISYSL